MGNTCCLGISGATTGRTCRMVVRWWQRALSLFSQPLRCLFIKEKISRSHRENQKHRPFQIQQAFLQFSALPGRLAAAPAKLAPLLASSCSLSGLSSPHPVSGLNSLCLTIRAWAVLPLLSCSWATPQIPAVYIWLVACKSPSPLLLSALCSEMPRPTDPLLYWP